MTNSQQPPVKPSTPETLIKKAKQLTLTAILCFGSFFILAITAAIPFNKFLALGGEKNEGLASYIPLIVGSAFLIGMVISMLGLVILLGCTQIQKRLTQTPEPNIIELEQMTKRLSRFELIKIVVIVLFLLSVIANITIGAMA